MAAIDLRSIAETILERRKLVGEAPTLAATDLLAETGIDTGPTLLGGLATPLGTATGTLGRFTLGEELGRGGMGRVTLAHDPVLLRTVAVKELLNIEQLSSELLARFVTEAQITAQLDHPNIVPVYELGVTDEGRLYMVLKRVVGRSLRRILAGMAAGDPDVAFWNTFRLLMGYVWVCNAAAYAHDRGVLHRDLKPANIMIGDRGQILVMDWGVARLMGEAAGQAARGETGAEPVATVQRTTSGHATTAGTVVGTAGYMSPEQATGELERLDARSDVFSLGAILFELLTLQRAYPQPGAAERIAAVLEEPPPDPRERGVQVDDTIAEVCMRAMAREPEQRTPTAERLAFEIGSYLEQKKG